MCSKFVLTICVLLPLWLNYVLCATTVRPYKFGFTIDEQQHRAEQKDERGIVMGEFGFITADGIYHVTVYATDEDGKFRILSMRNYPYAGPVAPKTLATTAATTTTVRTVPTAQLPKHNFNTEACSGCFLKKSSPGNTKTEIRPLSQSLPPQDTISTSAGIGQGPYAPLPFLDALGQQNGAVVGTYGIPTLSQQTPTQSQQHKTTPNTHGQGPVLTGITGTVKSQIQLGSSPNSNFNIKVGVPAATTQQQKLAGKQSNTGTGFVGQPTSTLNGSPKISGANVVSPTILGSSAGQPTYALVGLPIHGPASRISSGIPTLSSLSNSNANVGVSPTAPQQQQLAGQPNANNYGKQSNTGTAFAGQQTNKINGSPKIFGANLVNPTILGTPAGQSTYALLDLPSQGPASRISSGIASPITSQVVEGTLGTLVLPMTHDLRKVVGSQINQQRPLLAGAASNIVNTRLSSPAAQNTLKPSTQNSIPNTLNSLSQGQGQGQRLSTPQSSSKPGGSIGSIGSPGSPGSAGADAASPTVNAVGVGVGEVKTTTNTAFSPTLQGGKAQNSPPATLPATYGSVGGGSSVAAGASDVGDLYRFKYLLDYNGHEETGGRNGYKQGTYFAIGEDSVARTIEYIANEFGFQPHVSWRKVDAAALPAENTLKDYEFKWFKSAE
ncbi:protein lethal(3)malignant blood neoplasm 1 [Scaptodrosophila lebanonensis]|uniref:Protein lethal(3)malignant blood neoplasm 1 n=1 Tax=Drosophila lebanonensis TaxID=7225 RepID=A0A6J2UCI2_DROLE|nr:protein lethal(3)malignant blood neoplasm 1 [Scaptodrosophila lebanonensis]